MTPHPAIDMDHLEALAREAGRLALDWFRHTTVTMKADATPVTEADRAVESFLSHELRRAYPDFGILGEEGADMGENAAYRWVLDPIDGTQVFAAGLPIWGVSIGLMADNRALAGVVYLPAVDDLFRAGLEGPATLNGRPIHVKPVAPLISDAILFGAADAHELWDITFPGKIRAFGSCVAHICYTAAGSVVAGLNTHTAIWDVAAAMVILERAGGVIELMGGGPMPLAQMMRGEKAPEPILFGAPGYLDPVRRHLHPKAT
jgi:myo-inositol-1(or 4)-monophosphatase